MNNSISIEEVLVELGVDNDALTPDKDDDFMMKLSKKETTAIISQYLRYSDDSLKQSLADLEKLNFPESKEPYWFGFFMQTKIVKAVMKLKGII